MNPEQERFYAEALRLRALADHSVATPTQQKYLIQALFNAAMAIAARDIRDKTPQPTTCSIDGKRMELVEVDGERVWREVTP